MLNGTKFIVKLGLQLPFHIFPIVHLKDVIIKRKEGYILVFSMVALI